MRTFEECELPFYRQAAITCFRCSTRPTSPTTPRCPYRRIVHLSGPTRSTTRSHTAATFPPVPLDLTQVSSAYFYFPLTPILSYLLDACSLGLWEVGMVMWSDLRGGRCSMGDACTNPADESGVYEMLLKNFNRHYKSNRAPFSLYYHSAWFNTQHHRRGFIKFLDEILQNNDVYMVTTWQALQWVREPTLLSKLSSFEPFQCQKKVKPIQECNRPKVHFSFLILLFSNSFYFNFFQKVCNVNSKQGSRTLRTCQECPPTGSYPWIGVYLTITSVN